MKTLKYFFLLLGILIIHISSISQNQPPPRLDLKIGADLSMLKAVLDEGGVYKVDNESVDVLEAFKERKYEYARLRLFHKPNGENGTVNTLPYTIELAKQIKQSGLKLLLDFHYSDWWADPSQQTKPAAWADLDFETLNDSLYTYTKNVLNLFASEGITPDLVQTGNEIHHGVLWPEGQIWVDGQPNWANFTTLLKSAIRGVKESTDGQTIPIIVHGISSSDSQQAKNYLDNLSLYNVDFDIMGLSYYICWGGALEELDNTLSFLHSAYEKDIFIVETSYQAEGTPPDYCVLSVDQLPFPFTEQGQYDYLQEMYKISSKYSDVKGLFYWGGELIWAGDIGGSWSSLFHWQGNAYKGFDAFADLNAVNDEKCFLRLKIT